VELKKHLPVHLGVTADKMKPKSRGYDIVTWTGGAMLHTNEGESDMF